MTIKRPCESIRRHIEAPARLRTSTLLSSIDLRKVALATRHQTRPVPTGFTLIELMISVAMTAILLTVAVPSFSELIKSNRVSSNANELLAALQFARSEAVTRKAAVALCTSNTGMDSNNPTCVDTVHWSDGWLIFLDTNNNGFRDTASGTSETLLRAREALTGNDLTAIGETAIAHTIRFFSDGTASAGGTINLCDDRGAPKSKSVTVERYTGRTFSESGTGTCP